MSKPSSDTAEPAGLALDETPSPVHIRPADPADHDGAFALWSDVGFPTMSEAEWYAVVGSPTTFALLAEAEGALVGAAIASFDGWRAFIYHVAVAETHRGRGVAKMLMAEAETLVSVVGARYVYAMVHESNAAGFALAAVIGFEPEGDVVLVKELAEAADAP